MRSRDLMMMYGSNVFLVVFTVMEPSTRLSSHAMPNSFSARVTEGHTSRRYFSRYLGNSVANEDSSKRPSGLSSLVNASTFQWSMPSWSCGRREKRRRWVRKKFGGGARRRGTHPWLIPAVSALLAAGGGFLAASGVHVIGRLVLVGTHSLRRALSEVVSPMTVAITPAHGQNMFNVLLTKMHTEINYK